MREIKLTDDERRSLVYAIENALNAADEFVSEGCTEEEEADIEANIDRLEGILYRIDGDELWKDKPQRPKLTLIQGYKA